MALLGIYAILLSRKHMNDRVEFIRTMAHLEMTVLDHHLRPMVDKNGHSWKYSCSIRSESSYAGVTIVEWGTNDLSDVPIGKRRGGYFSPTATGDGAWIDDDFWSLWKVPLIFAGFGAILCFFSCAGLFPGRKPGHP